MEEGSSHSKLTMYLAVKAACDAKPSVWRRSEPFREAYADFCQCLENLVRLQPALGIFHSVTKGIAVELAVADTILTTEMDELIEQFEPVDVAFVDDYTAARSMEIAGEMPPAPWLAAA
jgi:hypothetical protein